MIQQDDFQDAKCRPTGPHRFSLSTIIIMIPCIDCTLSWFWSLKQATGHRFANKLYIPNPVNTHS